MTNVIEDLKLTDREIWAIFINLNEKGKLEWVGKRVIGFGKVIDYSSSPEDREIEKLWVPCYWDPEWGCIEPFLDYSVRNAKYIEKRGIVMGRFPNKEDVIKIWRDDFNWQDAFIGEVELNSPSNMQTSSQIKEEKKPELAQ